MFRRQAARVPIIVVVCASLPACSAPSHPHGAASDGRGPAPSGCTATAPTPGAHGRALRRFEILLPLRHNDGRPVPGEGIADTLGELRERFGAVSCETQSIRGQWQHEGRLHSDELIRVYVDAPDDAASLDYFRAFKERAKARFGQVEIWLITFPVEAL